MKSICSNDGLEMIIDYTLSSDSNSICQIGSQIEISKTSSPLKLNLQFSNYNYTGSGLSYLNTEYLQLFMTMAI